MSSIHRLHLDVKDYQEITVTGRLMSVAPDRGGSSDVFDLWFEHNVPEAEATTHGLYIFGTGHRTPWSVFTRDNFRFVGTVVTPSGLVWHIYVGPRKGEPLYA